MQPVLDWLTQNHEALVRDLAELVAVPSISTDGEHQKEVRQAAELTCEQMRRAGLNNVGILQTAGRLASEAVEHLFASSGSSAARKGTKMQRYLRDVAMYRGHIAAQYLNIAADIARVHFGLPDALF